MVFVYKIQYNYMCIWNAPLEYMYFVCIWFYFEFICFPLARSLVVYAHIHIFSSPKATFVSCLSYIHICLRLDTNICMYIPLYKYIYIPKYTYLLFEI